MSTIFGIVDLPTFIIGTILVLMLPGPNSIYVMTTASRHGLAAGYRAASGVLIGDSVLMLLTVLGAASVLKAIPILFIILKVIGALYLAWLGSQLFRSAYQHYRHRDQPTVQAMQQAIHKENFLVKAFSISLVNPKAILFFLSFFIQFVDEKYAHPSLSFLILAVLLQCLSFSYLTLLIISGTRLAKFFQRHLVYRILGLSSVALLFCGFALRLVVSNF